jgi:hypothetical protein
MNHAPHRARSILTAVSRAYPSAWQALDGFLAQRGNPDFLDWPDWCFVPVAGAYAVVSGGGANRVPFEQSNHIGLVAGLGAWRVTQGIYRFDPALYAALVETPITDDIPVEALHHLPGWCVYIETPDRMVSRKRLHGFFAFLEFDANSRREELRLLLDIADDPGAPFDVIRGASSLPLPLVGGSLASSLRAMLALGITQAQQAGYALSADDIPPLPDLTADLAADLAPLLSLLLYLCSAAPDVTGPDGSAWDASAPAPAATRRHGPRFFGPDAPRPWDVGTRLGSALRAAYQREQMGADAAETGRHVRPHVRRAHWHTFVLGPREKLDQQRRELRWLPPIPVAVSDFDALPSVIHPVR